MTMRVKCSGCMRTARPGEATCTRCSPGYVAKRKPRALPPACPECGIGDAGDCCSAAPIESTAGAPAESAAPRAVNVAAVDASRAPESAPPSLAAHPPSVSVPERGSAASTRARDAAAADIGVEARHRAAHAMLARFARYESLRDVIASALADCHSLCLDNEAEVDAVASIVFAAIGDTADARFLRELLGADPGDRMTRMHAHGALLSRATEAAWRLAGGDVEARPMEQTGLLEDAP